MTELFQAFQIALRSTHREDKIPLLTSTLRQFKCLHDCGDHLLIRLAEVAQLQICSSGDSLYRYGEREETLYLVLEGSLAVWMQGEGGLECMVGRLGPGMSCGGVEGKPSGSTVKVTERVVLCVLGKHVYEAAVASTSISSPQVSDTVSFLRTIPLFHKLSKPGLHTLATYLTCVTRLRGDVIYKEGDPATGVYIIVSGEVELVKTNTVCEVEDVHIDSLIGPRTPTHSALPIKRLLSRRQKTRKNELKLCLKGPREMFGEQEVITHSVRCNTAVVATVQTDLLFITHTDFVKRLQNPDIWGKIHYLHELKRDWMRERMENTEICREKEEKSVEKQNKSEIKTDFGHLYPVKDLEKSNLSAELPKTSHKIMFSNAILRQIYPEKRSFSREILRKSRVKTEKRQSPPPNFHAMPSSDVSSRYRELKSQFSPTDRLNSYDASQVRLRKELEYTEIKARKSLTPSRHNLFRVTWSRNNGK